METEEEEKPFRLGDRIKCPKCGVLSNPPFYICGKSCSLSISESEKETLQLLQFVNTSPSVTCEELKNPCSQLQSKIAMKDLIPHLFAAHQMKSSKMLRILTKKGKHPKDGHFSKLGYAFVALPIPSESRMENAEFRWPARGLTFSPTEDHNTYTNANDLLIVFNAMAKPSESEKLMIVHFWAIMGDPGNYQLRVNIKSRHGSNENPNFSSKGLNSDEKTTAPITAMEYYDFSAFKHRIRRKRKTTVGIPLETLRQASMNMEGKKHERYVTLRVELLRIF